MKSGKQCCEACHESHRSGGIDVFRCVAVCCLVSSAEKPAMNVAETNRCARHLGQPYIEKRGIVDYVDVLCGCSCFRVSCENI